MDFNKINIYEQRVNSIALKSSMKRMFKLNIQNNFEEEEYDYEDTKKKRIQKLQKM